MEQELEGMVDWTKGIVVTILEKEPNGMEALQVRDKIDEIFKGLKKVPQNFNKWNELTTGRKLDLIDHVFRLMSKKSTTEINGVKTVVPKRLERIRRSHGEGVYAIFVPNRKRKHMKHSPAKYISTERL